MQEMINLLNKRTMRLLHFLNVVFHSQGFGLNDLIDTFFDV